MASAERLARQLDISRNDALLRLAANGARIYEAEQKIAARREARWAAIDPGEIDPDATDLPSADEAGAAVLASRGR